MKKIADLRKEVLKILIRDYRRGEIGDMTVRLENLITELSRRTCSCKIPLDEPGCHLCGRGARP